MKPTPFVPEGVDHFGGSGGDEATERSVWSVDGRRPVCREGGGRRDGSKSEEGLRGESREPREDFEEE